MPGKGQTVSKRNNVTQEKKDPSRFSDKDTCGGDSKGRTSEIAKAFLSMARGKDRQEVRGIKWGKKGDSNI